MDKIYSNASNVIADLGEETPGSRVLFEELVEAEYAMAKGYSRPPPNNIIVRELEELLNRPWFRRVWVLQEVCVNSSVRFTCGSWSASCMALISCIFGYEKNTRVTKTICPLAILLSTHGQPEDVSTRRNLWNLLFQSRNCLATDPRDKTFALRSLIGHQRAEMDSLINYSQNFEDNFAAITLFLLPEIGPRLLVAARHPHGLNMPSWVPDWSQTLPIDYSIGTCAKYSPPLADTFLIQPPPQPRGGRWELRVKGMRYARVVQRSEVFSFKSIEDAEVQLKKVYHHLSNLRALFSQVYTRDDGSSYGQECPETESFSVLLPGIELLPGFELHRILTRQKASRHVEDPGDYSLEEVFKPILYFESLQRCRLFSTNNGFVGIAPEAAENGDVVCKFRGAHSPCLLRQGPDGYWRLISGDCFVYDRNNLDLVDKVWNDGYFWDNRGGLEEFKIY